jgi:hypothetical protein
VERGEGGGAARAHAIGCGAGPAAATWSRSPAARALHAPQRPSRAAESRPTPPCLSPPDWFARALVVDATWPAGAPNRHPIGVSFFGPEADLPAPGDVRAGDVVRLHRVKVEAYARDGATHRNLVASLGSTRGHTASLLLFRGAAEPGADPRSLHAPYLSSSASFTWDESETAIIDALRALAAGGGVDATPRVPVCAAAALARRGDAFDAGPVKVLASTPGGRAGALPTLWIWDGSDAEPLPSGVPLLGAAPSTRGWGPAPLAPLDGDAAAGPVAAALRPAPLPATAGAPDAGSAVPVVVFRPGAPPLPALPAPGSWVTLRRVAAAAVGGELRLVWLESTLVAAAADPGPVADAAVWPPADAAALAAAAPGAASVPAATLRRAASLAGTAAGEAGVRVTARVLAVAPTDARACVAGDPPAYALTLTLADATGTLDVSVSGAEAATFFAGLPPATAAADPARLAARLASLQAVDPAAEVGPWSELGVRLPRKRPASGSAVVGALFGSATRTPGSGGGGGGAAAARSTVARIAGWLGLGDGEGNVAATQEPLPATQANAGADEPLATTQEALPATQAPARRRAGAKG